MASGVMSLACSELWTGGTSEYRNHGPEEARKVTGVQDWPFDLQPLLATCQSAAKAVAMFVLETGSAWTAFVAAGYQIRLGRESRGLDAN